MPLPEPKLVRERNGVGASGMDELARGKRHRRCVEQATGYAQEWDNEKKLKRVNDMISDLRGGNVQAEEECCGQTEQSRAAEDGIDADQEAGRDAPCQLFRRGPHAKQRENGKRDATIDPVVVDGLSRVGDVGFAGLHC